MTSMPRETQLRIRLVVILDMGGTPSWMVSGWPRDRGGFDSREPILAGCESRGYLPGERMLPRCRCVRMRGQYSDGLQVADQDKRNAFAREINDGCKMACQFPFYGLHAA